MNVKFRFRYIFSLLIVIYHKKNDNCLLFGKMRKRERIEGKKPRETDKGLKLKSEEDNVGEEGFFGNQENAKQYEKG